MAWMSIEFNSWFPHSFFFGDVNKRKRSLSNLEDLKSLCIALNCTISPHKTRNLLPNNSGKWMHHNLKQKIRFQRKLFPEINVGKQWVFYDVIYIQHINQIITLEFTKNIKGFRIWFYSFVQYQLNQVTCFRHLNRHDCI